MNESQRRAFTALGIGPLWRLRSASAQPSVPAAAPDALHRLLALSDESGDWLFVAESSAASAGDGASALPPGAMRLLERMLAALGLRPAPRPEALARCIDSRMPQVLVALGEGAARALLGSDEPLETLRGRTHEWRIAERAVPLVVSAHPSRLLEAPQEKAAAWADLCLAREARTNEP